ncbi:hypothetical protein rosag_20480 [Roseisolibacter agri]|uniref:Uncharacterized protein n=1 Tax=Roseisolibacter agri TaxID=2014610 RepID=A0AA37Q2T2_9BACT|nr:hypothetical protein rosag_20480 [Roseisolibacter agri]
MHPLWRDVVVASALVVVLVTLLVCLAAIAHTMIVQRAALERARIQAAADLATLRTTCGRSATVVVRRQHSERIQHVIPDASPALSALAMRRTVTSWPRAGAAKSRHE